MSNSLVFDEGFMRRLEQLSLVTRRVRNGQFRGERRSTRRGQSVEFADYRNYTPGDDLRSLDWNIYARLDRPFIKLFEEEIDQSVHILLDASGSMDWPVRPTGNLSLHKWTFARRLAAALGYIALANHDRLHVANLAGDTPTVWGPERRRRSVHRLLSFLSDFPAAGETQFSPALTRYAQQVKRPGLLFLLSDFLTAEDYQSGLSALQHHGHEITILHILSPDEIEPALSGDFRLEDVETAAAQDITVNATMKKLYRQQFERWQDELSTYCLRRNINYALIPTDQPFEALLLQHLRQRGWVR